MKNLYLVILVLVALVSSLWSAEPVRPEESTPVSFLGIEMGEYIPQDAEKDPIKVPKGFDGCAVMVSPLTRRVISVTVAKKLSEESKAVRWMDTLISGLALSANAQLVYDQEAYYFEKGRLNVTVWQTGQNVYLCVTDALNDDIHSAVADARGWTPTAPLLPTTPATE